MSCKPNALVLFNPVFNNGPGQWGHTRAGGSLPRIVPGTQDDRPWCLSSYELPEAQVGHVKAELPSHCTARARVRRGSWRSLPLTEHDSLRLSRPRSGLHLYYAAGVV